MSKLVFVLIVSSGTGLSCPGGGGTCEVMNMSQPTTQSVHDDIEDCKKAGIAFVGNGFGAAIRRFTCQPAQR
jgi:hypothetical protein